MTVRSLHQGGYRSLTCRFKFTGLVARLGRAALLAAGLVIPSVTQAQTPPIPARWRTGPRTSSSPPACRSPT